MILAAVLLTAGQPFFRLQHGVRWEFVDPKGKPFWSLGACCTDLGASRKDFDPKNPGYASYRLFPSDEAWVSDASQKLRDWGLNSLGGWSDDDLFRRYGDANRPAYFVVLHLGAYNKIPWNDLFSEETKKILDKAARDQILRVRDDPKLIGYFSDNELGWWREAVLKTYLGMSLESPGKQKLVEVFRSHYHDSFSAFQSDWTTAASRFEDLGPDLKLRPGAHGMSAVIDFQSTVTTFYYKLVRDLIRRYDANHLILGDRYCQFYYPNVAVTAKRYVDAISTNYGSEWNTGENSRFFLDTLNRATGKPVIVTEFYMTARENRSGDRNSSDGFPVVETQKDRAAAVARYLDDLGSRPFVVGAHWFQFYDEPGNGRGDGENYNMGLVDITGRPYEELTDVFGRFSRSLPNPPIVAASGGEVPVAPGSVMTSLKGWPKRQGFLRSNSKLPFADLYLSHDGGHLYLGLLAMGFDDGSLYATKQIPEPDRPFLTVSLAGKIFTVRYGGGRDPESTDPAVKVVAHNGVKSEILLSLPESVHVGSTLRIRAVLWTHGHGEATSWDGSAKVVE